jgi:hypothetical protein
MELPYAKPAAKVILYSRFLQYFLKNDQRIVVNSKWVLIDS